MPNAYTVCLLFTPDLTQILLQTKNTTDFAGCLNGTGGRISPNEKGDDIARAAGYKALEETGMFAIRNLIWLGTLHLPRDCKTHDESNTPDEPACTLHYYAGVFDPEIQTPNPPEGREPVNMYPVDYILSRPVTDASLAGGGDLQYFIKQAVARLKPLEEANKT